MDRTIPMRKTTQALLLLSILITACESQRTVFDKQVQICDLAEHKGIMETAVEACTSALEIALSNKFSPADQSLALYKLASLKRKQSDYVEAESLLKKSITIEEQKKSPSELQLGHRLLELSLSLAGQGRWDEGSKMLQRLLPIAKQFSDKERTITVNILKHYAVQLKQIRQTELAMMFEDQAKKMIDEHPY